MASFFQKFKGSVLYCVLCFIHVIFDVTASVLRAIQAIWLLTDLKQVTVCSIESRAKVLPKLPTHVAFIDAVGLRCQELAKLVVWALAVGIKNISLYDHDGHIKSKSYQVMVAVRQYKNEIRDGQELQQELIWHENIHGSPSVNGSHHLNGTSLRQEAHISFLSAENGKNDIVSAAQKLATKIRANEMDPEAINEQLLQESLETNTGMPDPDLLVRIGQIDSNLDFPPWQTRLSEIHRMDNPGSLQIEDFFQVLMKFSKCEQRMASSLESYVNRMVSIITSDGRNFVGTLKGFDQTINLILDDTHERVFSASQGVEQVVLGLHIVRGDNVAIIGEIDEEVESRIDLNNIKADPIISIVH